MKTKKSIGNCWVCDGSGRVIKFGCTKTIACKECDGTGWLTKR
jgi:hypothetical protein